MQPMAQAIGKQWNGTELRRSERNAPTHTPREGTRTQMSQVLVELLHGKGAHVDPIACVEDLSAELAAKHVPGFPHSISQLVFHMNYWMSYELRRIRGERPQYPQHAAESFPTEDAPF